MRLSPACVTPGPGPLYIRCSQFCCCKYPLNDLCKFARLGIVYFPSLLSFDSFLIANEKAGVCYRNVSPETSLSTTSRVRVFFSVSTYLLISIRTNFLLFIFIKQSSQVIYQNEVQREVLREESAHQQC